MKSQHGPLRGLNGTAKGSDITFYQRDGEDLWRKKSNLTKERVKTDPAFAKSRRASAEFGEASKLAQKVYSKLPQEKRKHGVFGKLTGLAGKYLKEGKEEAEAIRLMKWDIGA